MFFFDMKNIILLLKYKNCKYLAEKADQDLGFFEFRGILLDGLYKIHRIYPHSLQIAGY